MFRFALRDRMRLLRILLIAVGLVVLVCMVLLTSFIDEFMQWVPQ